MHLLLSLSLALAAPPPDAGITRDLDGGFDPADPATWHLSAKLGKVSALRAALVGDLTAPATDGGTGEQPLTADEANALLDDPRADLVYGDKTVSIVAPSMAARHRQEHLDLLKLMLTPERLDAGVAFAQHRAEVLERVEKKTGVAREVIVSILMWETKLGTITGDFQAFNAFTSQLYFIDEANAVALGRKEEQRLLDKAKQAAKVESIRARAKKNLLALARQCKSKGIDALAVKGSWAGAIGYPQFMPASLKWADDGNGDGKIDLFDFDDSIASVGRYLAEHGYAQSRNRAVWDYNHEEAYVAGVLAYADALKAARLGDGGAAPARKK